MMGKMSPAESLTIHEIEYTVVSTTDIPVAMTELSRIELKAAGGKPRTMYKIILLLEDGTELYVYEPSQQSRFTTKVG